MPPTFNLTPKQEELQRLCAGSAKHVLVYGGSRSGKTFLLVYAIITRAIMAPKSRHAIFRRHGVAVKQSIGLDTFRKVMELAYPEVKYKWNEQDAYFAFPNGSEVWLAGLDDKERVEKVLGKEFATLYFNEASEIPLQSYTVAQTRLAQKCEKVDGRPLRLKCYADLNPTTRAHWTYRMWQDGVNPDGETPLDADDYVFGVANPRDNTENLPADYLLSLSQMPERARRRFYLGEYTSDLETALWRREYFQRVAQLPNMRRVVVAIDPAVSNEVGSDETGIICAGMDDENFGYILADESGKYRPEEWARRALAVAALYKADRIVAEVNQGGDMVESVLRAQNSNVSFKRIVATRGKVLRAEPIAALYETRKIFHSDTFEALEEQMCSFSVGFSAKEQGWSPDRVDAAVYALTELFPQITKSLKHAKPYRVPKQRFIA